ncbi:MAG: winged helix-turn-helix transcriptional regulator [Thermoplasmatota archaeon]
MDGLDFRILAALHEEGLASHAALGRQVGLTAPAVASRLQRLRDAGVLLGFRADLHPALFGTTSTLHALPGPHDEADAEAALALPGVVWVAQKLDRGLTVMAYGETDLDSIGHVARQMPGDGRPPAPPGRLARKVLAAVVTDPRAGRDRLARATGLSPKTCAKHREALMAEGLLSVLPVLGALSGEGAVVYHLAVFGDAPVAAVRHALVDAVLVNEAPGVQYWFCMASDLGSALARQGAVRELGLEAQMTLNRRLVQNDARLLRWLGTA